MLKRRVLFLVLIILILFSTTVLAQNTTVRVEGVSFKEEYQSKAKEVAVNDGLRKAVEKTLGATIQSRTEVKNSKMVYDKISKQSKGYIKSYKIVDEFSSGPSYRVKMIVKVKEGKLVNDLDSMEFNIKNRTTNPRIMFIIHQRNASYVNLPTIMTENEMMNSFLDGGFKVVDRKQVKKQLDKKSKKTIALNNNYSLALKYASNLKADIVVIGNSTMDSIDMRDFSIEGITGYSAHLTAKAIEVSSGNVITTTNKSSTGLGGNKESASQEAIKKVSKQSSEYLIENLSEKLIKKPKNVLLHIEGMNSKNINFINSKINKLSNVEQVYFREFNNGLATFNVLLKQGNEPLDLFSSLKENVYILLKDINNSELIIKLQKNNKI